MSEEIKDLGLDDDDEDEALPVVDLDGTPLPGQRMSKKMRKRERRRAREHKGNTKVADIATARDQVVAEAQGQATFTGPDSEEWRTELGAGNRGKAIAALTSDKLTHNAGSGFGLA